MTYLDKILEILTFEPISIDDIIQQMKVPSYKLTYVIDALKKGIQKDLIQQIKVENVKNKYYGHKYCKY